MKHYIIPACLQASSTVIIANGDFPSAEKPLSVIHNAKYTACCDGALSNCINNGIIPDAIIGDCDSIQPELINKFKDKLTSISEQETNDLTKTVNYCVKHNLRDIIIVGATGKREDHTLGNISLLMEYRIIANIMIVTDYGVFIPADNDTIFTGKKGWQVSIINFSCSILDSEGLAYPTRPFTNWWQGTLNEMQEDQFVIHADGEYLVYISYDKS
jgi:thiamine pyrophosphokinase